MENGDDNMEHIKEIDNLGQLKDIGIIDHQEQKLIFIKIQELRGNPNDIITEGVNDRHIYKQPSQINNPNLANDEFIIEDGDGNDNRITVGNEQKLRQQHEYPTPSNNATDINSHNYPTPTM